jgi:high-affinity iron transporter
MTNYFNVGAFFVLFREAVEATIILSVLLRYVDKTVLDETLRLKLRKQVWYGSLAGIILSIIVGIALTVVFYVIGKDLFGEAEPLYEGIMMSIAVLLLTWLAFRMLKINVLVAKWERKIQKTTTEAEIAQKLGNMNSLSLTNAYSLAILAFTVVVREGLEAVIFIAGVCFILF